MISKTFLIPDCLDYDIYYQNIALHYQSFVVIIDQIAESDNIYLMGSTIQQYHDAFYLIIYNTIQEIIYFISYDIKDLSYTLWCRL